MEVASWIRLPNLLITAASVLLFIHCSFSPVFDRVGLDHPFTIWHQFLIIAYLLTAMVGGYWVNDYQDVEADKFNRPHRMFVQHPSLLKSFHWLYGSTILMGVLFSSILSYLVKDAVHLMFYTAYGLVLHVYSMRWKSEGVIGNMVVSACVAFVPWLLFIAARQELWEIFHVSMPSFIYLSESLGFFSLLMFLSNFSRELSKSIEDGAGDRRAGIKTTYLRLGPKVTRRAAFLSLVGVFALEVAWLVEADTTVRFAIGLVPLLWTGYILVKLRAANDPQEFQRISLLLKILMVVGLFQLGFSNI